MAKYLNVSPLGALDVPALGRTIEAGEAFDVPDELDEFFNDQAENFQPVTARSKRSRKSEPVPGVDVGISDTETGFADSTDEPAPEADEAAPAAASADAGEPAPEPETPDAGTTPKDGE